MTREARVNGFGKTQPLVAFFDARGPQNHPNLFLHRAPVASGAHAQALLHARIEVADRQRRHASNASTDVIACNAAQRALRAWAYADFLIESPLFGGAQ